MSFHIYPCDLWTESFVHGDSCKVKKCGFRLLSPEDFKKFGLANNPDYWNSYKEDNDATSNCAESSNEEPMGRGLDAEREDHQTHCKSEIIDVEDYEAKEEENGDISGFNKSVPSRIIACGSVIKEENVLNGSQIVLESSVSEQEEEEDKQSQSGTIEKDKKEDSRSVSHGCVLFLSLYKEICEGILGKKSRSGREVHQESSSKFVQERLEELEETVQNLQSENIKLRYQNNQFSQYFQMSTQRSPPFPMHSADQNPQCFSNGDLAITELAKNQFHRDQQMSTLVLPPGYSLHLPDQSKQISHSMSLLKFPTNQMDHERPSSSSSNQYSHYSGVGEL